MHTFKVNNKEIIISDDYKDKRIIDFLRDDLNLTSVKDGCSSGACGSCSIIIDNKLVRSCLLKVEKLSGKNILTIEGISDREKEVYTYSFKKSGAVQCGYCIPAMVLATKVLFLKTLTPTDEEIRKGIKGNICRCTGYVKIIDAIKLSAKMFRENLEVPKESFDGKVNSEFFRIDADEKIVGTGIYGDDLKVFGLTYGKALRVKYPRAKILKIDISEAKKHKDCIGIVLKEDITGAKKIGHIVKDWDVLLGVSDISHYLGDSVALVCSRKKESLQEILDLIEVEYEIYEPITNVLEAKENKKGLVHEKTTTTNLLKSEILLRGNPLEEIEKAKYKVTRTYEVPFTEHAFMEVESATAIFDGDELLVYTSGQGVYDEQREIAEMLGLSADKIQIKSLLVGGGFGGKEDMSVQHHASLLSYIFKKPVRVTFTRDESILIHPKRHKMTIEMTTACDENGYIKALKADIISDAGAYASLSGPVLQRACTHAGGPYNYQNILVTGETYYTNNPPGGAFRGFGVSQSAFGFEANLSLLALMVGISDFEIRYRNAVKPFDILPNGQICDSSTALVECLDAVKDIYESNKYVGIACSFKNSGLGVGIADTGRCILSVVDGKVSIRTSASCIGQGIGTVCTQILCTTTNLKPEEIIFEPPNTKRTPNSGTTTASRQTVLTGNAVKIAGEKLKIDLEKYTLKELEGKEYLGEYSPLTDPISSEKENPVSHVAYGYGVQVVILDDSGKLKEVIASYDCGKVINKKSCEGQVEGGIVMGLGYALTENYILENCIPKSKYKDLGLFRATDVPEIKVIFVEKPNYNNIAFGAKGVGELATIPTAPAVQNAYYKYDKEFRNTLPLSNTLYNTIGGKLNGKKSN